VLKSGGRDTPREVAVYRDVLAAADLGTPRLVAASAAGAGWLLVDALPGGPLWQSADVASWCTAARWLAVAHRRLHGGRPPATTRRRHGLRGAAQPGRAPGPAGRRPALRRCRRCRRPAGSADRARPRRGLPVQRAASPSGQVCLVDWETAGSGPGLLDLAALCAGWPPDDAARIAASYAATHAEAHDGPLDGPLDEPLDEGASSSDSAAGPASRGAPRPAAGPVTDHPAGGPAGPAEPLALLPAARLLVALRWIAEPPPAPGAGGGHARGTDWWAEAVAAAEQLP
jgi:hypothetical protein